MNYTMKKIIVIICLFYNYNYSKIEAQTIIPSGIISGIWTNGGSPYLIQGHVLIPNDSVLAIEPGVVVQFQGAFKLNVQGKLLAIGTITDSITFTCANTSIGWRGIRFDNTAITNDSTKIQFCKIKNAIATGVSPENYGGGIYINGVSKIIISQSSISNCKAMRGAAIYFNGYNCSPIISNNTITYNTNDNDGGGAIFCDYGSTPLITSNTISYNSAVGAGAFSGGITCSSNPTIINNTISNNTSFMNGGGINCANCNAVISNNIISNNSASTYGGGIYCGSINYPILKGNIIANNSATKGAGVFCTAGANATLSQSIICNNTASGDGGGICFENGSVTKIVNSTIVNNNATNGGGMYCIGSSNPSIQNSILYGNTAISGNQVFVFDELSDPSFTYCNIEGGLNGIELNGNVQTGAYSNNINSNPLFIAPSSGSDQSHNGLSADWSLQNNSPCIDTGNPTTTTTDSTDFAGNTRITVCRVDMGAYEYQTGIPLKLSLTISQPVLCHGDTTGEVTAIVSGGSANYLYNWSNGQTDSIATGLAAGTYTLTVSETSYGCSLSKTITLTQPTIVTLNAGPDKTITCGGSIQFDNVYSNFMGPGVLTYSWTPAVGLDYDSIINPICSSIVDTTYVLKIKTPNGCELLDSINVSILPLIANAGGPIIMSCDGVTQVNSVFTNYTGTAALSYQWIPSTGLNNDTIANPTVNQQNQTDYQVSVTTENGCIATDSMRVIVMPLTITSGGSNTNTTTCNGTIALSTSTNYQGIDTLNYLWTPSEGLSDSTIANPTITVDTNKAYTVTITTTNGCTASTQIMALLTPIADSAKICIVGVNSNNKNIVIWNKPISTIIESFNIYKETNVTNIYTLIGSVNYDSLSTFIDTSSFPSVQSNKYRISIKDKCGVETNKSEPHKTMHLAINQGQGNSWNLIWDAYEGFVVPTYNIYRGSSPGFLNPIGTSSGSNSQYTDLNPPVGNLYYQVELIGPNVCNPTRDYNASRSNIATNNISNVFNITNKNSFEIYPNPAENNITITTEKNIKSGTISIMNLQGEIILRADIYNQNSKLLEIENLSSGVYFITLRTENYTSTKKLIKQ
jgi:hypothetical protein